MNVHGLCTRCSNMQHPGLIKVDSTWDVLLRSLRVVKALAGILTLHKQLSLAVMPSQTTNRPCNNNVSNLYSSVFVPMTINRSSVSLTQLKLSSHFFFFFSRSSNSICMSHAMHMTPKPVTMRLPALTHV